VFGLTRSAIIVLGLVVFCAPGWSPSRAQHRGLSQPGAGDSRDHRAGGRPVRRGDGALLHHSDGGRPLSDAGVDNIRSTSFYGLSFVRVTFKYGVDFYFA
jgi:cobalt-zinc-cadmium resistance protein CzcA